MIPFIQWVTLTVSLVCSTHSSIHHRNYFQIAKGHVTQVIILPAARVFPLHSAILCLWGLEFPVPGLLSFGCKIYCSHMCKAQLYYELSSYNRSKMAVVEWLTLRACLAVCQIMQKINSIRTHCGVANESVHSLARGHMIRVWCSTLALYVVANTIKLIKLNSAIFKSCS